MSDRTLWGPSSYPHRRGSPFMRWLCAIVGHKMRPRVVIQSTPYGELYWPACCARCDYEPPKDD